MDMGYPLYFQREPMENLRDVCYVERLFTDACLNHGLQFILCPMRHKDSVSYKNLKSVAETPVGVVTQCFLAYGFNKSDKQLKDSVFDERVTSLALKINAKLGGSNTELSDGLPCLEEDVMVVGADVNHSTTKDGLSIAAVVASLNWPAANRYVAQSCLQKCGQEKIQSFGDMCWELVENSALHNKKKPANIVIFRDGVGDRQFEMVLNKELQDFKRVIQSTANYSPRITVVVAQKRHKTRIFRKTDNVDGTSFGNVSPGTIVDREIVHPFEFDFYLCSHWGNLGTSKSIHYCVLWNEHGFSSDQVQQLTYNVCYPSARCTRPVSLVLPVHYADLAAYRGRMYCECEATSFASRASSPAAPSFSLQKHQTYKRLKVHENLKDLMYFL